MRNKNVQFRVLAAASLVVVSVLAVLPEVNAKSVPASKQPALKQDDPGCKGCLSQAASLFASGKALEASELLQSWSDRCPRNAQLHLLLSTVLIRLRNRGPEAAEAARKAVMAAPESVPAHLQYALVLMGNGESMRSTQEFEKVVELEPSNYEAWSSLSELYSRLQEDEKAQKCSQKAADLEPSTSIVRLRMLKNLQKAGKLDEARAEVKRLIANQDFGPEFMQQLAGEALAIGAYEDAIAAGSRVVEVYPRSLSPLRTMALAQLGTRSYGDCLESAKKMLVIDTASGEASSLEGLALVKLGRTEEAEKTLQATLKANPELPLALLAMATLQLARGDYAAASDNLRHSFDNEPALAKRADFCFIMAQALDKQGDNEDSLQYYRQSLSRGLSGAEADEAKSAIQRLQSLDKTEPRPPTP